MQGVDYMYGRFREIIVQITGYGYSVRIPTTVQDRARDREVAGLTLTRCKVEHDPGKLLTHLSPSSSWYLWSGGDTPKLGR